MSEMRTNLTRGRKVRRIAAVALVLVLLLGVVAAFSASAANGLFKVNVYDNTTTDENGEPTGKPVTKADKSAVDGASNFSNGVSVNLKTDEIFTISEYTDISQVKRLEFSVSEKSTSVTVSVTKRGNSGWSTVSGSNSSKYYYSSDSGVDKTTFDTLMNDITVTCKKSSSSTSAASVKLTLEAGTNKDKSINDDYRLGLEDGIGTKYTEVLTFFTYATATVDPDSVKMQFKNGADDATLENPSTDGLGTVTFNMLVNNVGDGSFLRLGYQIKKSTETWDTNTTKMYAISESTYRYDRSRSLTNWNAKLFSELGTVNSSTGVVTNPKPVTITVSGLNPEIDYDIRGVVVTNNDTAAYTKAINVPRVKYTQPVISVLNIGNTAPQEGGVHKEITAAIEFNNSNYNDTQNGPQLKMQLFFTTNRVSDGGQDKSVWTPVGNAQTKSLEKNDDGSYKTNLDFSVGHDLPKTGNSKASAYKLVVTDVNANSSGGYFVTKYSDATFVLDNDPPTQPQITASGLSANLQDGTAVVGGANSRVDLTIAGSADEGSGVKEYSYEMYYLESDLVDNFIDEQTSLRTGATNQQILQAMSKLNGANASKVCEYTPSTSLVLQQDGSSTLAISKDGFYALSVTAVDNVGKASDPTIAIFRVDLTPPTAPVIALAAQKDSSAKITAANFSASSFEGYDDRTYSDATVWVFVRTDAQAGKTIDPSKYQFSINGGLVWRSITSAVNFDRAAAYVTKGGTVSIYDSNYNSKTGDTFTYDAAFQLSCDDINGYQTVVVRAVDEMGNTSLPSDSKSMRTTEIIRPRAEIEHEGVEVAVSLGNTTLETIDTINQDLRNDIALKINEKYFGTNHAYNGFATNNNPISLLYTSANTIHQCTWNEDTGARTCGTSCPYEKYAEQYSLYTPSMVNIQGVKAGVEDAADRFEWVRFDHTNVISESVSGQGTVYYPTVVFDDSATLHTTADTNIDPTKSSYQTSTGVTRYTAMTDYVVYTGQATAITTASKKQGDGPANVARLAAEGGTASTGNLTGTNGHNWTAKLGEDTYTAVGRYALGSYSTTESSIPKRIYHMVDMTTTTSNTNGNYTFPTASLASQGAWSTIYTLGYYYTSSRDWMFVYNGQATRKEIFFSTDDSQIVPHSNDGYGFLFNTTIRQNIAGEWVISGYLFGLGTKSSDSNEAKVENYQRFIFRLTDVRLDWFASSRVTTSGASFSTSDDFFAGFASKLFANTSPASNGSISYGSQTIELLAYTPADGLGKQTRNYVFVTEGASAEAFVWNAASKTRQQLQQQFDTQKNSTGSNSLDNNTSLTAGYTRIHWKNYNNTTAYKNENPSKSAKGVGTDYVLYVPRPIVDGTYSVGDLSKFEDTDDPTTSPHSDSNCFGFGPITFARSSGHGCERDSLVVFTNVTLRAQKANDLADVITQPKWGTGKVKYILNISDDSIQDLTDPIMSATVAWRIQNDSAKFISWGSLINKKTTQNFIDTKIDGNGKYIVSRVTGYDDQKVVNTKSQTVTAPGQRSQSKQVAEYIADTYYKSYGIELKAGETAPDKVAEMLSGSGAVISMENAKLMTFSVTPESYNSGTANEDFPSGRWYITYDATGYAGRTSYARFSDALDLTLNKPGRYQVYFAPDMSLLGNVRDPSDDKLDPDGSNCIFDLVVNEEAYAQPIATVDNSTNIITVNDFSIDPDNNVLVDEYNQAANKGLLYSGNQLLTGIVKTYWRWELAAPYTDPTTKEQESIVLMKSGVTAVERSADGTINNPFNGLTVEALTKQVGKLYTETGYNAATYIQKLQSSGDHSLDYKQTGTTIYYDKVPKGATITVYEQVEDISTRRVLDNGVAKYVELGRTKSPESSANLIADAAGAKPIRPASSLTLSTETMYDTADNNDYITVTRTSFHGQKEPLTLGWEINDRALTAVNGGASWTLDGQTVLEAVTAPSFNSTTGRTSGTWKISKSTIARLAGGTGKSFSLAIIETVTSTANRGTSNPWPDGSTGPVKDNSSRAIYYQKDERAPTMQTVTLQTGTRKVDGTGYTDNLFDWGDYEASNYLDMTADIGKAGEKIIKVSVSGSFDSEGYVEGYAYAFYSYAPGSSDLSTATYYYLNADKKLVQAAAGEAGVKTAIQRSLGMNGNGILTNASKRVGEDEEFSFVITKNAMHLIGTNGVETTRTPMVSLNLGVFAYDNQTGNTTPSPGGTFSITGANETIRTKVENIKLATFEPMPVAITAVNTTGETISTIGNDNALTGGKDQQVTSIPVANTKVTVSFTPRQDWFKVTDGTNALETPERVTKSTPATKGGYTSLVDQLEAEGDVTGQYIKYFTDKTGAADLTNRVTIDYKIERKAPGATTYTVIPDGEKTDQAYTSTVSINDSGDYIVTAKAKNGSGVYSSEQTLTFSVDREPPTPAPTVTVYDSTLQPYNEGEWVQGAVVFVGGSKDADMQAYYKYSIDNGATWLDTSKTTHLDDFQFTISETGTHYVRVKAVDTGGNEAEASMHTVMVDNTPPKVSPPNTKVESTSVTVFADAIISISQTAGGVVYSLNADNTANMDDQEVIVDPGDPASFVIIPDAGMRVFEITLGATAYSPDELKPHDTIAGGLVLEVPQVNSDGVLQVTFTDAAAVNYMATARAASFNALGALRIAVPELYANEDAPVAIAATHALDIYENNDGFFATETTPDLGYSIPDGSNVVLSIEVFEGYRIKSLSIERQGSQAETVPASALTFKSKNHYEYVLTNVKTDVVVRISSEEKTPTTATFDVDGNGSITIDDEVTIENDTYTYATYLDDDMVLKVKPLTQDYALTSLTVDGKELVTGTAVDTYTVKVTADMEIKATFAVASDWPADTSYVTVKLNPTDKVIRGTISPRGTVSTDPNTGTETHVIPVFSGDDQVILLKPDPTYTPTNVTYLVGGRGNAFEMKEDPVTGYYRLTLPEVKGAVDYNVLSVDFTGKQHKLSASTIAKELGHDDVEDSGGTITYTVEGLISSDTILSQAEVPEGSKVSVKIEPDSGYRIESVTLNGKEMGKRRNLTFNYVNEEYKIVATFLKRNFGTAQTSHSMTVTAVGISDGQEALNNEPYSFKLNDGAWSAFQSNTSISYTNLDPNTEYTVTVRARDRRGNISSEVTDVGANATTTYTLANMPAALDVEAADDTDNVMDKTVKISVDSMGNPAYTQYAVYYSARSDMRNRELADVSPDGSKWNELDGFGQITVYHLNPGTKYYLQVIAKNKDDIATEANDQNVLEITLSPTAPPDNTLYFEEQSAPGQPIKLHWDDPAGEVEGFQIYRDGTLITEIGKDLRDYTDSYDNLRGDGAYVYSYAYRNSAGVGARRTAVSAEYYNKAAAVKKAKEDGNSSAQAAAEAELKKLDDLVGTYTNLYKEVMTYPSFPSYFTKVYATPLGITTYNGQMVLRIQADNTTTARSQRYKVGLHAYEKRPDGTYQRVADGTQYGASSTWNSASTEKYTTVTTSSGASVTWDGLNINWEYRVYVKEVTSTGWTTYDTNGNVTDGYYSGSAIAPETALHKRYTVNYQGYGFEYVAPSSATGVLQPGTTTAWNDATANAYTQRANDTYTGWNKGNGDGIELVNRSSTDESGNYINFNKSPQIFIPKDGSGYDLNFLYGTVAKENTELNAYGNRYLVVEQNDDSMKVKLHVKVYDPDGPADGNLNYTVTGTLGGVTARTTIAPTAVDRDAVGTDEATATEAVLEFDLKNLATGVYGDLKLSVANGSIDVAYEDPTTITGNNVLAKAVNLVVNQSLPTISASNGGGTKKVEEGRDYGTTSTLKVTASVSANNQENLRKVRMILMASQYQSAGLGGLFEKVMNGTANASEIEQIDKVQPPMTAYFQITEEKYKELAATQPTVVLTTAPTAGLTYYWVEKEYALTNDLCSFLERSTASDTLNHMIVRKPADDPYGTTYPVLMVAYFGKNQSTMNLRFQVMEAPALTVETEQTWAWVETTSQEYDVYEHKVDGDPSKSVWTIGDVYQEAVEKHALNPDTKTPEQIGFNHGDPAMQKVENSDGSTTYSVFKLWDNKATIQSTMVSSYIQIKTGMYSQINQAQVVMVPDVATDPANGDEHAAPPANNATISGSSNVIKVTDAYYQGSKILRDGVRANFTVTGLESRTTYYMWVYYQVTDPETNQNVWYHAQECLAMTTDSDYKVATVGFQDASASYEESEYDATGKIETATMSRLGDYEASSVRVEITAEYYKADQYGAYELDENGEKIQLMPGTPEYQLAADTLTLISTNLEIAQNSPQIGVTYRIRNNNDMQGHMIVRLVEKVVGSGGTGGGINRVTTNADSMEIFLLDDESPITAYRVGVDELDGLTFVDTSDSHLVGQHYDFAFGGLPYPYGSADTSSLSLAIKNAGDGELNNITATLYAADRKTESKDFVFATPPTLTSLASPDEGVLAASERSMLKVVPADTLQDGIYEGWLKITADLVKKSDDEVWIHLYQVVGQATLKGNIYIGESKPETTTEHVGIATVKLYSSSASVGSSDPLYQVDTDDNGYFEIPNILVNQTYSIMVDRIGCSTYNSNLRWTWTPRESAAYRFDLQMVAGDIDNNGMVNILDRNELEKYMNHTIQEALDLRDKALEAGDAALAKEYEDLAEAIRRCDLDQNGGVNSIDRMLLWQNLNKGTTTGGITVTLYKNVTPTKITD